MTDSNPYTRTNLDTVGISFEVHIKANDMTDSNVGNISREVHIEANDTTGSNVGDISREVHIEDTTGDENLNSPTQEEVARS